MLKFFCNIMILKTVRMNSTEYNHKEDKSYFKSVEFHCFFRRTVQACSSIVLYR